MYKIIGNKIRAIRQMKNISQEYTANKLNISQAAYSKIESGQRAIHDNLLTEIAKIMEVTKEEILIYDANNYLKYDSLQKIESSLVQLSKDIQEIKMFLKI